jgi:hypothetical protein
MFLTLAILFTAPSFVLSSLSQCSTTQYIMPLGTIGCAALPPPDYSYDMTYQYACCNTLSDNSCSQGGVFGSFLYWPLTFTCNGKMQCDPNGSSGPFVYSCTCSPVPDPSQICPSTLTCPAGKYISNGQCLPCQKDEWSSQGATSCQKCPCTQTTGDQPGTKKEDCKDRTPNKNNNKCSEEETINNEGFCPRCYLDTAGKRTIGIGFNLERRDAEHILKQYGLTLDVREDCTSTSCLDLQTTSPPVNHKAPRSLPVVERRQTKIPTKKPKKPAVKLCKNKDKDQCSYCDTYPSRCLDKDNASKIFDIDYKNERLKCAQKFAPNQPPTVLAALADMAMGGCKKFNSPPPEMQAIQKD